MEATCDTHRMRNATGLQAFCENITERDNLKERGLDWGDIRIHLKEVTRVRGMN